MWTSPQADAIGGILDHIPLIGQLKNYCERGGVVEDLTNAMHSIKDRVTDMAASVKDKVSDLGASIKEKVSPSQDTAEVSSPEKGHGIGLSAQKMAAMEANAGGLGTREISAPEQATFASLCSGMNMNTQGIRCDQQHYTTAQLGELAVNTGKVQTQSQGLAVG